VVTCGLGKIGRGGGKGRKALFSELAGIDKRKKKEKGPGGDGEKKSLPHI